MFRINDISIRNKLILMQVFTSVLVLSVFVAVFVISDIRFYKERKSDSMISLAHVIGTNSSSTLEFQDNEAAKRILSELKNATPEVVNALILDKNGKTFASYSNHDADSLYIPSWPAGKDFVFTSKYLFVRNKIIDNGEALGQVILKVELSELSQIRQSIYNKATLLLLVALGFSFLVAIGIQTYISKRLLQLVNTMKKVGKTGDYSQTIPEDGSDEISILIRGFNDLMKQVSENEQTTKEQSIQLEEKVKSRTAELRETNLTLQQSNNDLQQFAHVASHDLKEPLRKIKIFLGLLAKDPEISFSEVSKTYFSKVDSAADRMSAMIEGVLNYSMINAMEQKIELVDLNDIILDIETDLELLIAEKEATILFQDLPSVQGSSFLLYQLFYNLINNSLKFSLPARAPVITIRCSSFEEDTIKITEIRLSDNGIGFDQDQAENIFNPFTRLHSKNSYEGTGLGLSLCKRIVLRHEGAIQAEGKTDEGTVFIIKLPVNQEKSYL